MTSVLLSLVIALVGIIGAALWYVLGRVNSRIDRVDTRLDGFDERLRSMEAQLIRSSEKLIRVDETLIQFRQDTDLVARHMSERLDTLVRNTEGIDKRLGG